ncbi:MAG: serine--tRNA ligase, partial [Candidatus Poseidoniia archaeon]|nr:serine--tRNA ligase [Candidatus Poseidoniia archaeon]
RCWDELFANIPELAGLMISPGEFNYCPCTQCSGQAPVDIFEQQQTEDVDAVNEQRLQMSLDLIDTFRQAMARHNREAIVRSWMMENWAARLPEALTYATKFSVNDACWGQPDPTVDRWIKTGHHLWVVKAIEAENSGPIIWHDPQWCREKAAQLNGIDSAGSMVHLNASWGHDGLSTFTASRNIQRVLEQLEPVATPGKSEDEFCDFFGKESGPPVYQAAQLIAGIPLNMSNVVHAKYEGFTYGFFYWFDGPPKWPSTLGTPNMDPPDWANPDGLITITRLMTQLKEEPDRLEALLENPSGTVVGRLPGPGRFCACAPKPHNELLETLAGADLERAAKIAGRRFYFLTGGLARLELALVNYAVELLAERGYEPVVPPFVMNREAYEGVVDLGDFEEVMYKIEDHDLYLIATSEHPLTARFRDEILEPKSLPLKFCGLSTNFRREVGAHGLSDRGIWRVHQFAKVEQVVICKPEDSAALHEELLQNAVDLLARLELPFRVVEMCAGDIGTVAARKFDLEAWMPSVGEWKEVVSASNCTAYQSVRLNMRYRTPDGTATPHTLNATGIATTRTLAAILENCQRADGSVAIPKPLRKWMGDAEALLPA